jgi:hypothetical protein
VLVIGTDQRITSGPAALTYRGQRLEIEIGPEKVEYVLREGECLVFRHET